MSQVAVSLASRLGEFVGAGRVLTDPASLAAYEVDGRRPSAALLPGSVAEIAEILRFASAERLAVVPVGGKTHLHIGMPPHRYDLALDVSGLNRVLAYEPHDLTLGVEPGITYAELDRSLREKGQFLPLSPPFAERATLGGIVAAAADTPLRYAHGTARDFLLGVEFVTGEGTVSKSGGRVVKNVTGYDLHKLLIGSLGTLAVMTRLNFRTFPLPPSQKMFVAAFTEQSDAFAFCRAIMKSPLQPRIVDVLNPGAARLFAARDAGFLIRCSWSSLLKQPGTRPSWSATPAILPRCHKTHTPPNLSLSTQTNEIICSVAFANSRQSRLTRRPRQQFSASPPFLPPCPRCSPKYASSPSATHSIAPF